MMDLVDALASAVRVESAVGLSVSEVFKRKFSSVYDTLNEGEIDEVGMSRLLYEAQPETSETIAGYEVYATDATAEPRASAKTLADRSMQKSDVRAKGIAGHKYQWLVRLVTERKSWVAPQAVERVKSSETANLVAARQAQSLDQRSTTRKVVVADSGYVGKAFLAAFVGLLSVVLLIRLRNNQALYGAPPPPAHKRGRPARHGQKVKLNAMPKPDREERCEIRGHTVILQAWSGLHFKAVAALIGMVVCVTFLKPDGTPKFKRPLWLFWTGAPHTALLDIARMYLWRFCIEHFFRFMKQHMGLCAYNGVSDSGVIQWMRVCMLAYWQLLASAHLAQPISLPWRKLPLLNVPFALTPRQVQLSMPCILIGIGTPASSPRPSGKAPGRAKGFRPKPRMRHPIVYKSKKPSKRIT